MPRFETGLRRRQWLELPGVGAVAALAGCTDADDSPPVAVTGDSPCADAVTVTEEATRIGTGVVPEVRLRIHNAGDETVAYELRVVFLQGTSLGIDARTGRETLSGTLDPGESALVVATDDARDVRNTDTYELALSARCVGSESAVITPR